MAFNAQTECYFRYFSSKGPFACGQIQWSWSILDEGFYEQNAATPQMLQDVSFDEFEHSQE